MIGKNVSCVCGAPVPHFAGEPIAVTLDVLIPDFFIWLTQQIEISQGPGENMAKSTSKPSSSRPSKTGQAIDEPWLTKSAGLKIIAVVSIVLAVFTGWQVYPAGGLGTSIVWGLGSAAAIWAVFGLSYLINVLIHPRNR
jgi:hypothetical protein